MKTKRFGIKLPRLNSNTSHACYRQFPISACKMGLNMPCTVPGIWSTVQMIMLVWFPPIVMGDMYYLCVWGWGAKCLILAPLCPLCWVLCENAAACTIRPLPLSSWSHQSRPIPAEFFTVSEPPSDLWVFQTLWKWLLLSVPLFTDLRLESSSGGGCEASFQADTRLSLHKGKQVPYFSY